MLTKEVLERKVNAGYTAMGMADFFDADVQVIYRALKKHGLKIRRPYEILDDERSVILNLRTGGMKIKDIAKVYEIEYQCIRSTTVKEWFRQRSLSKASLGLSGGIGNERDE